MWRRRPAGPTLTLGTLGRGPFARQLRLSSAAVSAHRHVIGLSGMGKSKLLALLAVELIEQGVGVAVIDPHADLTLDILACLASRGFFARPDARERLWYIDFATPDRYLPFNVVHKPGATPHQIAQELNEVCQRAWPALADGAAPQFENLLLASVVVLAENGRPLTDLAQLLTDRSFRDALLTRVSDPRITAFFHARFDRWGRETPAMLESTLRRVFLLTFSPTLRYSLGQTDNALDFRALMDRGTSLLCNLGGLDEATQTFLGCLLTVGFETAALSRADLSPAARRPYHLVLDEFSQFSAQSEEALARVLSLCRKYGLFLTLAHQTWSQLSSRMAGALQNAVEIAFRLGRSDAEWAAPRFGQFDLGQAKRVGSEGREYPVSVQESFEWWTAALEALAPREAYVSVGKQTTRIRTRPFPRLRVPPEELSQLCEGYRTQLLRPHATVAPTVDALASSGAPATPVRRLTRID